MLRKKIGFEDKLVTFFSMTFVLIIVIGIISFYYSNRRVSTAQLVRHTNEVLLEAEQTLSLVKDIESGARGYIITGDSSYLDYFNVAETTLPNHINHLKDLTKDNPAQQERVDSLFTTVHKRILFSLQSIQLRKEKGMEAINELIKLRTGKSYTDKIRELTTLIKNEENNLLRQRQLENNKSIAAFNRAFYIFLSCVFILLVIIFFTIRQNIQIRKKAEGDLSKMNNELEQKVLERTEKLSASENQFRYTLDNMLEGAQIIGFDWRYIYVNDSLAKHGKYSKEELVGHTVMEKYPGIEQTEIFQVYKKCFEERVSIHLENEFTFPDKTKGWFELSFQPVPEGIFILSIDITERKKIQQEIEKLNEQLEQKVIQRTRQLENVNKELEAFSYSISHDLRAPLRAIIGFTEILEERYVSKLDDEARRISSVIKNNTLRMGSLIDDLLAFSRLGRQDILKNSIDTNEMVKAIIQESGSNNNISWNIHELPGSFADVNTLRQVWINLISNAIKYSRKVANPTIEIGSFIEDEQQVFFVKDNGVGFDPKYSDKLFKVFQRLHSMSEFEGTGVGLAIVEKIISKHGGKVWVEAEKNKGACFFFSLPIKLNNN